MSDCSLFHNKQCWLFTFFQRFLRCHRGGHSQGLHGHIQGLSPLHEHEVIPGCSPQLDLVGWVLLGQEVLAAGHSSVPSGAATWASSARKWCWHRLPCEGSQRSRAPMREFCTCPRAFRFKQPGKCAPGGHCTNDLYTNH